MSCASRWPTGYRTSRRVRRPRRASLGVPRCIEGLFQPGEGVGEHACGLLVGAHPYLWARARHEAVWRSQPSAFIPIERLPAEGILDSYRSWAEGRVAEAVDQERLAASAEWDDPSGKDGQLVPIAECMKQTLASERERCMVDPLTLGWHPASPWCIGCRLADPCRERLGRRRPAVLARRIAGAN
jgi:hypothetical protein